MDMLSTLEAKIESTWSRDELNAIQKDLKGLQDSGAIDIVERAALTVMISDRKDTIADTPAYERPLRVWREENGRIVTYHVEGGGSAGPKGVGSRKWVTALKATDQLARLIHESGDLKEGELAEIVLAAQNLVDWAIDNGLASE